MNIGKYFLNNIYRMRSLGFSESNFKFIVELLVIWHFTQIIQIATINIHLLKPRKNIV